MKVHGSVEILTDHVFSIRSAWIHLEAVGIHIDMPSDAMC